jgi:stress-induced morphogen
VCSGETHFAVDVVSEVATAKTHPRHSTQQSSLHVAQCNARSRVAARNCHMLPQGCACSRLIVAFRSMLRRDTVRCQEFAGLRPVKRHQLVYSLLAKEMEGGMDYK